MIKKNMCKNLSKFKSILLIIIIAFLCEFLCQFNAGAAIESYTMPTKKIHIDKQNIIYNNIQVNEYEMLQNKQTPQIFLENLNTYVYSVEVKIDNLSVNVLPIRVYSSQDGVNYEEESVTSNYTENMHSIIFNIQQNAMSLRLDMGTVEEANYKLNEIIINPNGADYIRTAFYNISYIRMFFYCLLLLTLVGFLNDYKTIVDFLFKYRWILGLVFVVLCVFLKLHGSSIGEIGKAISGVDTVSLWGKSRSIRSDEYVVFTEMALSQVKVGFEWFSNIWGYSPTDMFITYGQPVKSIVSIYRPFS